MRFCCFRPHCTATDLTSGTERQRKKEKIPSYELRSDPLAETDEITVAMDFYANSSHLLGNLKNYHSPWMIVQDIFYITWNFAPLNASEFCFIQKS